MAVLNLSARLDLPKDVPTSLAAQTTFDAARMAVGTGEHPAKLKDKLVTPPGTTIEELLELERYEMRATMTSAVTKATERAKEQAPPA